MLLEPIEIFEELLAKFYFKRKTKTSFIISSSFNENFEQIIKQQQEQIAALLVLIV